MLKNPFIIIAIVIIIFFGMLVLAGVLFVNSNPSKNMDNASMKTDTSLQQAVEQLQMDTQNNVIKDKYIDDIGIFNRLSAALEEFYESMYFGEFNYAYSYLDEDFALYKGIENEADFRRYAEALGLTNKTGDILGYTKINDNTYILKVATLARNVENMFSSSDDFNQYIQDRRRSAEYITVSFPANKDFTVALEGFVAARTILVQGQANNIAITANKQLIFNEHNIIEVEIKNEGSSSIRLGSAFKNIVAKDSIGNYCYADAIDNTIENEVLAGQTKVISINIRNGDTQIRSITFNFTDDYHEKSIELNINR